MVLVAFIGSQTVAATLAPMLVPVLLLRAGFYSRRAILQKRTTSQRPPSLAKHQKTTRGLVLLRHGTHMVLTGQVFRRPADGKPRRLSDGKPRRLVNFELGPAKRPPKPSTAGRSEAAQRSAKRNGPHRV